VITRRALLSRLGLVGAVGAGAWLFRQHFWHPTPAVTYAPGAASSGWLPLVDYPGVVVVEAEIAGRTAWVLIDSGAQASVIDRRFAQELGLETALSPPMIAFGVNGAPQIGRSVSAPLRLGDLAAPGLRALELDLGGLPVFEGRTIRMIVGRDVMRAAILDIDFAGRRLALRPTPPTLPPDAINVPVKLVRQGLHADVEVEGALVEVLVDTGASAGLALGAEAAERAGLLAPGREMRWSQSVTFGGVSRDRQVTARTVRFAERTIRDLPVQVFTSSRPDLLPDGLLGVGLLGRFRVVLDLDGGRLDLIPRPLVPEETRRRRRR
jgi:predicted aspartyl protease